MTELVFASQNGFVCRASSTAARLLRHGLWKQACFLGSIAGAAPASAELPTDLQFKHWERRFFPDRFSAAIVAAGSRARLETLKAGLAFFCRNWKQNLDVMEQPDGRKFEVCFIAGAPRESNYKVIRELDPTAAWYALQETSAPITSGFPGRSPRVRAKRQRTAESSDLWQAASIGSSTN
jgi:hypothetical protein